MHVGPACPTGGAAGLLCPMLALPVTGAVDKDLEAITVATNEETKTSPA